MNGRLHAPLLDVGHQDRHVADPDQVEDLRRDADRCEQGGQSQQPPVADQQPPVPGLSRRILSRRAIQGRIEPAPGDADAGQHAQHREYQPHEYGGSMSGNGIALYSVARAEEEANAVEEDQAAHGRNCGRCESDPAVSEDIAVGCGNPARYSGHQVEDSSLRSRPSNGLDRFVGVRVHLWLAVGIPLGDPRCLHRGRTMLRQGRIGHKLVGTALARTSFMTGPKRPTMFTATTLFT